jgi:hypothetical protein
MMEISIEKDKITGSLNELENEFKKGNIPKSHYESQKRQLTERLETLAVAERVMKLQGKETVEAPVKPNNEAENEELFKKFITSPGLKDKNIGNKKGLSQNTMILAALLIAGFAIGAGAGIYFLNIPEEVSSVSMFTNDSAFPPFVLNNTTNATNNTNSTPMLNESKTVTTPVTTPTETRTTTGTTNGSGNTGGGTGNNNSTGAAGDPGTTKTPTTHKTNKYSNSNNSSN